MNLKVQVIDRGHVAVLLHQLAGPDDDLMQSLIPLGTPVGRVPDRLIAVDRCLVCTLLAACATRYMRMKKSGAAFRLRRPSAAGDFRSALGVVVVCIGRDPRGDCSILKLGHDQCLPYLWNTSPRPQMTAAMMRMPTTPQRVEVLTVTRKDWSSEVSSFCALTVIA